MPSTATRTKILDTDQVQKKILRIAHQIYEIHHKKKELVIVGISKRGFMVAGRIADAIAGISPMKIELVELKMDKNDMQQPVELSVDTANLKGKQVILVDDVLNSGRVLMYAAKSLLDVDLRGLTTAVLVDRRHRSYPIRADYVGLTLSTTIQEHISVVLSANGDKDAVYLE